MKNNKNNNVEAVDSAGSRTVIQTLHQWVTVVAIPFMLFMITDIYRTFKEDHDRGTKHTEEIRHNTEDIETLKTTTKDLSEKTNDLSGKVGQINLQMMNIQHDRK